MYLPLHRLMVVERPYDWDTTQTWQLHHDCHLYPDSIARSSQPSSSSTQPPPDDAMMYSFKSTGAIWSWWKYNLWWCDDVFFQVDRCNMILMEIQSLMMPSMTHTSHLTLAIWSIRIVRPKLKFLTILYHMQSQQISWTLSEPTMSTWTTFRCFKWRRWYKII